MNCYNGDKYLRQAIDSVLAQTYSNLEIIFWDNQSTDSSAQIVKSYADTRLRYFYAPRHTWLYEARNYAIENARGEFVAFLDVDDWWLPRKLEQQIPRFGDPQVGFVCGNYWIQSDRKGKRWQALPGPAPTGWVLDELLKSFFVGLLTLVVRRAAISSLEFPCDPRYHMIGDFDLVVRLSTLWKLDCVQEPIACYRLHGSNESAKHRGRHVAEMEQWLAEMSNVDAIRSSANLHFVELNYKYLKILDRILQGDKHTARLLLNQLPWGQRKVRLCIALFAPTFVVRSLKN
jgi:glycosyltransferase involved in cell wall biosynthesis